MTRTVSSVFFDASALYAAAYSTGGAARELLRLALRGQIRVVVSQDVLDETERNLTRKAPEVLETYGQLLHLLTPEVVNPTREEVWAAEEYVAQKDAPIIAAAIRAQPDYLVTFDRKHLIDPPEVAEQSELRIVTPGAALRALREQSTDEEDNGQS
jgi:predicted nucleic acid-binding protein